VDTGKTVDLMRKTLGRPHMPVLAWVARDGVNPVGLYAAAVVPADRWVVFPWEQADAAAVAAEQEAYRAARQ
jgi:hypoxanthine phosphoribosyltransferase